MTNKSFLRKLRESNDLSQEQLAKELDVSRPTYLQIEKGQRDMTIPEAKKLAGIFGMSLEAFIEERAPDINVKLPKESKKNDGKQDIRINVPQKKLDVFKEVLLYILNKVGAKPNIGETVIYKLLYFIDFDYYEKYEEQLIGATYIKNKYGPTPVEFNAIVKDMKKKGELDVTERKIVDYTQRRYLPLREPDLKKISARDIKHIDDVLLRFSDKSARSLSEYSHGDMPWKAAEKNGDCLEYEMVFYRDDPYSVRSYDDDPL